MVNNFLARAGAHPVCTIGRTDIRGTHRALGLASDQWLGPSPVFRGTETRSRALPSRWRGFLLNGPMAIAPRSL